MTMFIKSKKITSTLYGVLTLLSMSMINANAYADERETLEELRATTINLIDLLVQEGVLPKNKADAIVKQATAQAEHQAKQSAELNDSANAPYKKKTNQ